MREPPFAGGQPVYVGDDLTDESAFEAARDLGGYGVLVGPLRDTAAAYRLPGVGAVLAWLGGVRDGAGRDRRGRLMAGSSSSPTAWPCRRPRAAPRSAG